MLYGRESIVILKMDDQFHKKIIFIFKVSWTQKLVWINVRLYVCILSLCLPNSIAETTGRILFKFAQHLYF